MEALAGGHHMRIIDHLSSTYHPWELMFQWLPVYLQPSVSTFFYRIPKLTPLRQNLIVIHGYAALVMSSTPTAAGLVISSLYRDHEYVRLFDAVIDTILADSHPMMQAMEVQQLSAFLHMVDTHVKSHRVLYMINRLPTFRNMPSILLEEILRDNNLSSELLARCMAAGRQSASTRGRCQVRQIYDLDAMDAAAAQDYIIDPDLSALTGQEIRLSRAQFLQQLSYLCERKDDAHYTLVLYPFSHIGMITPPCNMIVQEDSLAAAWDAARFSRRMYTEELSIVSGFCEYADTLWESIPAVCKTQAWRKRRLNALLHK